MRVLLKGTDVLFHNPSGQLEPQDPRPIITLSTRIKIFGSALLNLQAPSFHFLLYPLPIITRFNIRCRTQVMRVLAIMMLVIPILGLPNVKTEGN